MGYLSPPSRRILIRCCCICAGTAALAAAFVLFRWSAAARADVTAEVSRLIQVLELRPGMSVADIGAGSGELTVEIARQLGPESRVYGTDIDPDRLREIRQTSAGLTHVTVVEGHAIRTNLPDACCDAIFMRMVYHHFADPQAMNASIRRSLKPGGRLAVIDFAPRNSRARKVPPRERASGSNHGVAAEAVVEELTKAGFEDVHVLEDWPGGRFLAFGRNPSTSGPEILHELELSILQHSALGLRIPR
jgi:precorrin-6B methylase 2